ncbi:hypothetical protein FIBSPDRAFT_898686 [Athelia psychrophila]|uniref:Uncharacterized protein n=1 Tax=Athelia psychrophila TaxID=1759441 RepID=A0A166ANG7_9AGAM|nr:hypothetical protein FIBSPDRAFT_898686 [Fibularhizoctonia sp. CBS 109695]
MVYFSPASGWLTAFSTTRVLISAYGVNTSPSWPFCEIASRRTISNGTGWFLNAVTPETVAVIAQPAQMARIIYESCGHDAPKVTKRQGKDLGSDGDVGHEVHGEARGYGVESYHGRCGESHRNVGRLVNVRIKAPGAARCDILRHGQSATGHITLVYDTVVDLQCCGRRADQHVNGHDSRGRIWRCDGLLCAF